MTGFSRCSDDFLRCNFLVSRKEVVVMILDVVSRVWERFHDRRKGFYRNALSHGLRRLESTLMMPVSKSLVQKLHVLDFEPCRMVDEAPLWVALAR